MPEFIKELFSPLMREFFAATSSELGAMARRKDLRRMLAQGAKEQAWEAFRHAAALAITFAICLLYLHGLVDGSGWIGSVDESELWHYLLFLVSYTTMGVLAPYALLRRNWEDSRDVPDAVFRSVLGVLRLVLRCVAIAYGMVQRLTLLHILALLGLVMTSRFLLKN